MHKKTAILLAIILSTTLLATSPTDVSAVDKQTQPDGNVVACFERACTKTDDKKIPSVVFAAAKRQFMPELNPSLNADLLFDLVNAYRAKLGLPAFIKDAPLCQIAESRKPELMGEIFGGKGIHSGFRARNLPYWATENMKYGPNEQEVLQWWIGSSIHHRALVSDSKYSCSACSGHVCIQLFTNYIAK